jgi:hypothetical protein
MFTSVADAKPQQSIQNLLIAHLLRAGVKHGHLRGVAGRTGRNLLALTPGLGIGLQLVRVSLDFEVFLPHDDAES